MTLEAGAAQAARTERADPARLGIALGASFAFRGLGGVLLALPVVSAIASSGIRNFPEGDAKLFEAGGLYLMEVLVRQRAELAELVGPSVLVLLGLSFAGIVPEWLTLRAVCGGVGEPAGAARRVLPRMAGLAVVTWALRVLVALATVAAMLTLRSYFASARDERLSDLAGAGMLLVGLGVQAAVSVLHDVAALFVVTRDSTARDALFEALLTARRSGLALAVRYLGAGIAALGVLAAGALLVSTSSLHEGSSGPLVALGVHQLAVLLAIVLRAAWLWSARRTLDAAVGGTPLPGSGRSVLVDLEVTPGGRLPAQVEAQEAPGEPGPGGAPERGQPARDGTE